MRAAQAPKASKGILKSLQEDGVFKKDEMLDTHDISDFMEPWKNNWIKKRQGTDRGAFDVYAGDFSFNEDGSLPDIYESSFSKTLQDYKTQISKWKWGSTENEEKLHLHFIVHDQLRKHFTRLEIIISTTQQKDKPNEITDVKIKHIDSKYQDNGQREVSGLNQKHSAMASHVKTAFNVQKDVQYEKATTQQNDSYSCGYIVLSDILSNVSDKKFTTDDIRLEIAQTLAGKKSAAAAAAATSPEQIQPDQIKIAKPEDVEKYKSLGIKEGDLIDTTVLDKKLEPSSAATPPPPATAAPPTPTPTPPPPTAVTATATIFDKEFNQLEDTKKIELIRQAFAAITKKIDEKKIACLVDVKLEIAKDDKDQEKILFSKDNNTCEIHLIHTYSDYKTSSEKTSEVILKRTVTQDASKPDSKDTVEWTCTSEKLSLEQKYQLIATQIFEMRAANQNALKTSGIKHHEIEVLPLDGKAPTNAPSTKGDINKLADPKEKMVIQAFFTAGFKKVVYCGESFENPAASVSTASLFHNHSATQTDPSSSSLTPGP